MTNPIKPTSSPTVTLSAAAADAAHGAAPVEGASLGAGGAQGVQGAAPVTGAAGAVALDPLQAAIREVAADIKAGKVPDATAASEAVIIRLVNLRFGHLNEKQRRKMTLHLQEMLHRDPFFQSRIEGLLRVAHHS